MPDLLQSLQKQDIGFLRITASLWGVELASPSRKAAAEELARSILVIERVSETVDSLSTEARRAMEELAETGGKSPWAAFTRRFGELRFAGPGRRDREEVYLRPSSAVEELYYRSLVVNAFFDTPSGPQEFAYIPEDVLALYQKTMKSPGSGMDSRRRAFFDTSSPPGRPALPKERQVLSPSNDHLLDDAVTFLAALRMEMEPPPTSIPVNVIADLLRAAGILAGSELSPQKVKSFLEMPPAEALSMLGEAWRNSDSFNELRQLPGLICEGEWQNAPLGTRRMLLGCLEAVPLNRWWSLPSFVHAIKEKHPDFQRPAGDYDSWFIKRASDGTYLRGFSAWDEVDGALIRYLITGPLFWLGRLDLARAEEGGEVTAFRVKAKPEASRESARLTISSGGNISVPRLVPRLVRYQMARFCEWLEPKADEYRYRVTVASLQRAGGQGLKTSQLLSLLAKNASAELPPAFVKALKRWEAHGTEARVETRVVLRVSRPEVLEELRRSKAGRFLAEALGPTAVIIKAGAQARVLSALAEMGLLAEVVGEEA